MRARPAALVACLLLASGLSSQAMADWQLEREDDFRAGAVLDPAFWSVESGFQRNQEAQYYTPANIARGDGFLRIEARREEVRNAAYRPGAAGNWRNRPRSARYTSGSIHGKAGFLYGRVEVVARSPGGAGVWPAIWLLHESAGQYGEIDIFEAVGKHADTAFAGVHYGREPKTRQHRSASRQVPGFEGSWHVHAVEWTPESITVSLDGQPLLQFDPSDAAQGGSDPLRRPMQLRINLALGGTWGGAIDENKLPAHFDIASVRIWRWVPSAAAEPAAEPAGVPPRWGR